MADEEPAPLFDVLRLPKPVLHECWATAFDASLAKANELRAVDVDVFLSFHAAWYHLGNREYISAVDFSKLAEPHAVGDCVITLIDDIYDVRSRLSVMGGLFEPALVPGSDLIDVVHKLRLILDWRAFELTLASRVATVATSSNHVVFAVKHPLRTFNALLYGSQPRAYLSHHITTLRQLSNSSLADERELASQHIVGIQSLARELRDTTVLFEPTTIDEFRFSTSRTVLKNSEQLTLPVSVLTRWPLAAEESELLFDRPAHPLPELGEEWGRLMLTCAEAAEISHVPEAGMASALYGILAASISSQINSRDHALVEQSDVLVIYRPYLLGNEAGGVKEEFFHHDRLLRGGLKRSRTIVLHHPEDERLRPRKKAQQCLQFWAKTSRLRPSANLKEAISDLVADEGFWEAIDLTSNSSVDRQLKNLFARHGLEWAPLDEASALAAAQIVLEAQRNREFASEFINWCNANYLASPLGEGGQLTVLNEDMAPAVFAVVVKRILSDKN